MGLAFVVDGRAPDPPTRDRAPCRAGRDRDRRAPDGCAATTRVAADPGGRRRDRQRRDRRLARRATAPATDGFDEVDFLAVDDLDETLDLARENAVGHAVGDRVRFALADLVPIVETPFDVVLANLPYIATAALEGLAVDISFEPRHALDGGPGRTGDDRPPRGDPARRDGSRRRGAARDRVGPGGRRRRPGRGAAGRLVLRRRARSRRPAARRPDRALAWRDRRPFRTGVPGRAVPGRAVPHRPFVAALRRTGAADQDDRPRYRRHARRRGRRPSRPDGRDDPAGRPSWAAGVPRDRADDLLGDPVREHARPEGSGRRHAGRHDPRDAELPRSEGPAAPPSAARRRRRARRRGVEPGPWPGSARESPRPAGHPRRRSPGRRLLRLSRNPCEPRARPRGLDRPSGDEARFGRAARGCPPRSSTRPGPRSPVGPT